MHSEIKPKGQGVAQSKWTKASLEHLLSLLLGQLFLQSLKFVLEYGKTISSYFFFFSFGCGWACFVGSMGLNRGLCIVIYHRASAFNTTLTGSKSGLWRFPKERIHRYKSLVLHTHSSPPSQRWMLMCFRSTFITSNRVEKTLWLLIVDICDYVYSRTCSQTLTFN